MRFLGHISIRSNEQPDSLEFIVTCDGGWIEIVVEATLLVFFVWMAFYSKNYFFILVFVFGLFVIAIHHLQGKVTRLIVTSKGLVAKGNLRDLISTETELPTADLSSLGYRAGGRHRPFGLYADDALLLPAINHNQVNEILEIIRKRFSEFQYIAEPTPSGIFAGSDEILTLKLRERHDGSDSA